MDGRTIRYRLETMINEAHTTLESEDADRQYCLESLESQMSTLANGIFRSDDIETIVAEMAQYSAANPTHGLHAAGKDPFLYRARAWYRALGPQEQKEFRYLLYVLQREY